MFREVRTHMGLGFYGMVIYMMVLSDQVELAWENPRITCVVIAGVCVR